MATSFADSDDPTSLRAKALSTLKAKRKRPAPQQTSLPTQLPPRPPPPPSDSLQLDYGGEDTGSNTQQDQQPSIDARPTTTTEVQDAREEGEISEEEEPPAKQQRKATPTGPRKDREPKPSLLDRISAPRPVSPLKPERRPTRSPRPQPLPPRPLEIGPDRVRPNLHLSQAEYDKVKDLILDVLGWGVPPEHLVDIGLTRELVFYVFNELNLRLPTNLDTTGLVPYTPDTIGNFVIVPGTNTRRQVPPPQSIGIAQQTSLPSSISFGSSVASTPQDLTAMERQKKEELRARNAVLASLKQRKLPSKDAQPPPNGIVPPPVPSEFVDDFLNSITPTNSLKSNLPPPAPMDVDLPSFEAASQSNGTFSNAPSLPTEPLQPPTPAVMSRSPSIPVETNLSRDAQSFVPQQPTRRSGRRAVASDYLEGDQPSTRANSYDHTNVHRGRPSVKPKTGNGTFANLRSAKCIIHLSDTEDEDEEFEVTLAPSSSDGTVKPSPVPTVPGRSLLEEKEREIQRMKEELAQLVLQKSLLKKKGSTAAPAKSNGSSSLTPVPPPLSLSTTAASTNTFPPETPSTVSTESRSRL